MSSWSLFELPIDYTIVSTTAISLLICVISLVQKVWEHQRIECMILSHQYLYWRSNLGINIIMAKPYVTQKSSIQWICSKFFVLSHGHNYFWPLWLWRLLEAKNVIGSAHFGTSTQRSVHPTVPVLLTKRNKKQSKCSPINEISYSFQPPYLEF